MLPDPTRRLFGFFPPFAVSVLGVELHWYWLGIVAAPW